MHRNACAFSIDSGDFCVAMEWLTPFGTSGTNPDSQAVCGDGTAPFEQKSFILWVQDGKWRKFTDIGVKVDLDIMIRPTVAIPS